MPLRLIHTADWHLGQTLRGYSRDREYAVVLDHLVTLICEHQPNALIVAGDIFDSPNPSAEAQTLFFQTMVRLHEACSTMTTVIAAGNHDAANRLEAPRALLAAIGVHVVGNVRRLNGRTLATGHLVPLPSPGGELLGHVLAVSYPTAACLPAVAPGNGSSHLIMAVHRLYADLVSQTQPEWNGLPLVLTGHLHVAGAQQSEGSERRILIGGENAIPASLFPSEAAYIALGHLHKAQCAGAPHIRYSGSLLPLSASEIDYCHGVTLVEIDVRGTRTQHLPLPRPLEFHRLPVQGYASQSEIATSFDSLKPSECPPPDRRPFVYLRLSRKGLSPAFREEIDQDAEARGLRVLDIRLEDQPTLSPNEKQSEVPTRALVDHDVSHFFQLAFARTHRKEPEEAHRGVFHQVFEESQIS